MLKVIFFAVLALNVQFIVGQCSLEGCGDEYRVCIDSTGDTCSCYGRYLKCGYDLGCYDSSQYQTALESCATLSGCTYEQCLGNSTQAPTAQTPVSPPIETPVSAPTSSCSEAAATYCGNNYQTCYAQNGTNGDCWCYGSYLQCLYFVSCFTIEEYEVARNDCLIFGCTYQQCAGEIGAPVAETPVSPPITTPSAPSSNCSYEAASYCGVTYQLCYDANPDSFCSCYGPYFNCLYSAQCLSIQEYNITVNYCTTEYGCTYQQCTSNVTITPPVTAPLPSTPVSGPTSPTNCSSEAATTCAVAYQTCVEGAVGTDQVCSCYGPYFNCLYYAQCLTNQQYNSIVNSCAQSGCTYQQCTANSTVVSPPFEAPVSAPSSMCDSAAASACNDAYMSCYYNGTSSNDLCNCYGPLLYCLYGVNCLTQPEYDNAVNACTTYGCTYQQCAANSTVVSPPFEAPVGAPSSSCSYEYARACADASAYCYNNATHNDVCACYGPYISCMYSGNCITQQDYNGAVNYCTTEYGCTYQQCTAGSYSPIADTPVQAPLATTPVNPPFSSPSTVICLQPWELVLIVVGSALAGIGIAAIVGVIIYLSRRQSTSVKGAKYAKLQRY